MNEDENLELLLDVKEGNEINCQIVNDTNNECTFNETCYIEKYQVKKRDV